jgi:signal transduction histidine kinase
MDSGKNKDDRMASYKEIALQIARAAELSTINAKLVSLNEAKSKHIAALASANATLVVQNKMRIEELTLVKKELANQNAEKKKRAEELTLAYTELVFQNSEKEKRAEELILANSELAFQNEEKEKRAAELALANTELVYQNKEKEKRATELVIANVELVFQNEEKEKRAAELALIIKELFIRNEEKGKVAAELIAANHELESFSYSVSHDLRAPLRFIHEYAKILKEDHLDKLDACGAKAINSIMSNSKRMDVLIDDLLAFAKLGMKEVKVTDINMNDLVESIQEGLIQQENKSIAELCIKALPPAKGDQSLIKQVWINLISNALKYSNNKPEIKIEIGAYEKDDQVVYYVKDNGVGFDMKYYDKLFKVFQRLHSLKQFEGTGIGLAVVHKIVSKHKGKIWAESIPDEGTCFYFSLPNINS